MHEYSIPKFGSVSYIFFFHFHKLCHKVCVSSFDLGRLSLRLGPTPYLPTSPPMSLDSLAKVIHAYCSLPAPEYERHYYTIAYCAYFMQTYILAQYARMGHGA